MRRPVALKYFEKLKNLSEALKREIEIKRWKREKKLKLIKSRKLTEKEKNAF